MRAVIQTTSTAEKRDPSLTPPPPFFFVHTPCTPSKVQQRFTFLKLAAIPTKKTIYSAQWVRSPHMKSFSSTGMHRFPCLYDSSTVPASKSTPITHSWIDHGYILPFLSVAQCTLKLNARGCCHIRPSMALCVKLGGGGEGDMGPEKWGTTSKDWPPPKVPSRTTLTIGM